MSVRSKIVDSKHKVKRRASAETLVLAPAEKPNAAPACEVVGLGDITGIITERIIDEESFRPYSERGITIIRA
jgi:hypothetical protein